MEKSDFVKDIIAFDAPKDCLSNGCMWTFNQLMYQWNLVKTCSLGCNNCPPGPTLPGMDGEIVMYDCIY